MSTQAVALPAPLVKLRQHPIKWGLNKLQLIGSAVILTYIGVLIVAGLYYLLFEVDPAMTNLWHEAITDGELRHNVRDVGEGLLGGLLAQQVIWNAFKKRKPKNWLDKIEIALHISNVKDDEPLSLWQVLATLPLVLLYAVPGFFATFFIAHQLHPTIEHLNHTVGVLKVPASYNASSLLEKVRVSFTENWDKKLMGFGAAYVFGRRPAKGVFDDMQLWLAERRVALGKPVRWYHPCTFKARYNFVCDQGTQLAQQHMKQKRRQAVLVRLGLASGAGFAGFGFYVLNFIAK